MINVVCFHTAAWVKKIFSGILFLHFFLAAQAQKEEMVYVDSTVLEDQVIAVGPPDQATSPLSMDMFWDTTLVTNMLVVDESKIAELRQQPPFGYIHNIDSLLLLKDDVKQEQEAQSSFIQEKSGSLQNMFESRWFLIFFWSLLAAGVGYVVYRLFMEDVVFKRKGDSKKQFANFEVEEEAIDKNSYDYLIKQSVGQQQYRLAVRYWYLYTIQQLAEQALIVKATNKTNLQYVRELTGKPYAL
ncbi:MAG: hypothetical protein RLY16_1462, partial [Bacteroidota bacterium]